IVPLESLMGFILDFFLSRLGAKVRIAKKLLENTDVYNDLKGKIAGALADEARGTAVDPNKYWRDFILDAIDGQFVEARNKLAVRVRLAEEARFGHDFRHVRVHTGQEAGPSLKQMRADAAASGSHVFLRPGLQPDRGEGARLLRHELTHVLQQTGPRPLGQVR